MTKWHILWGLIWILSRHRQKSFSERKCSNINDKILSLCQNLLIHRTDHRKGTWRVSPVVLMVKNTLADAQDKRDAGSVPGLGRSPGGGPSNHSSIPAWRIPWAEELGGLQSIGLQRVGHEWSNLACKKNLKVYRTRSGSLKDVQLLEHNHIY